MSGFYIPHGTAITIGLLIENKISVKAFGLSKDSAKLILDLAKKLIMPRFIKKLSNINLSEVNNYLINDKKAEGKILKIAVPTKIGHINFCKLNLNQTAIRIIKKSVESLLKEL
jgi:3-dehydroquinate synthetase